MKIPIRPKKDVYSFQILALQDERRAAEIAREEAERARKREAEEDKLKMKVAIEREARLAERREAVRLARQQEAQVTRNADKSKIDHFDDSALVKWRTIRFLSELHRFWHGVPQFSFPFDDGWGC